MRRAIVLIAVGVIVACAGFWSADLPLLAVSTAPAVPGRPAVRATIPALVEPSARAAATAAGAAVPESRLDVQRLLGARQFTALTALIEATQASVNEDARREGDLARIINAFDTADPALTPLIDAWVGASPASYAPRLARARHGIALAWARRGTKLAKQTSEAQFLGMSRYLATVVTDAQSVIARNARVGEAHALLIRAATAFGDVDTCLRVADQGIDAQPGSLRIRMALAHCLLPRWGGSYALIEALAKESDNHTGKNPALSVFHGVAEWDRGRLAATHDEALQHYARALEAGEHVSFYQDRAETLLSLRRYAEALSDTDRALALEPERPDVLVLRARALVALGRRAEAVHDARVVAEMDSTNAALATFRQTELEDAAHEGYRLVQAKDVNRAVARLSSAIALVGGNAEVHYWRGRAHLLAGDASRALADFEEAIRFDAGHFESYRNIDYILATRGDWDGVIRRWSQYLEIDPANGRAYFERGGARLRKGDRAAALEDARKACQLGAPEACQVASSAGR